MIATTPQQTVTLNRFYYFNGWQRILIDALYRQNPITKHILYRSVIKCIPINVTWFFNACLLIQSVCLMWIRVQRKNTHSHTYTSKSVITHKKRAISNFIEHIQTVWSRWFRNLHDQPERKSDAFHNVVETCIHILHLKLHCNQHNPMQNARKMRLIVNERRTKKRKKIE